MARHLGRVLLLLIVAALALWLSQLLDGSIASYSCAWGVSVEECLAGRRRAVLILWSAVVAAHVVILAAIVVLAWLLSQPPPRHRKELPLRRRAWSGLGVVVALVAGFLWSQTSGTIE